MTRIKKATLSFLFMAANAVISERWNTGRWTSCEDLDLTTDAKTRAVFEGYQATKHSRKYYAEHEVDIELHRAAQATFKRIPSGAKLPKMDGYLADEAKTNDSVMAPPRLEDVYLWLFPQNDNDKEGK